MGSFQLLWIYKQKRQNLDKNLINKYLWNNGQLMSQVVQANLIDIYIIDINVSNINFQHAE